MAYADVEFTSGTVVTEADLDQLAENDALCAIGQAATAQRGFKATAANAVSEVGFMSWINGSDLNAAATVTFSSIPATYQHLRLICYVRASTDSGDTEGLEMQFNGDTATNYRSIWIYGSQAAISCTHHGNDMDSLRAGVVPGDTADASEYAVVTIDIPNYADTNGYASFMGYSGFWYDSAGDDGYINISFGRRDNTEAVSSITLFMDHNYDNSRIDLYGISV
jgi:hypothetical protein